MTAKALAALHASAMTETAPWSARAFDGLLKAPGTVLTLSHSAKDAGQPGAGRPSKAICATAVAPLIGFALGRVTLDEVELLTLVIAPEHQRKRHGQRTLAAFEATAHAEGASTAFLEVAETNTPARALYLAAGWTETGRRKAYYRTKASAIDAILMQKPLPGA